MTTVEWLDRWPRVAVLGGGAVGSYFGGMLARAGAPVTLIARSAHADAVARNGLWIEGRSFQGSVPMLGTTEPAGVENAELVIVSVKTPDTRSAAESIARHLAPDALVISLQNGVDNSRVLQETLARPVIASVVYVSAEMGGPGRVVHNGRGDLVIGSVDGRIPAAALNDVAAVFERASIPCRASATIAADLWTKLTMNCAFNAVSALTRSRYGRVAGHEPSMVVVNAVIDEVLAVARAEGVALAPDTLRAAAWKLATSVPNALASTAQDILLGRRTEIDDLNGYVASRGAALGVPTPINHTLFALVKLLEDAPAL
jgi:2-dehydropantoate 2-reductase